MDSDLVIYRHGMDYGIGIDSPSGLSRNSGVIGDVARIDKAGGNTVTFKLTEISTDEDLQKSLNISASASAGIGCFSASASMAFAESCHVHSNSVFLLASVEVDLAFSQIRIPKIAPEAAAKLADGDTNAFQDMYGDRFVRGMQTGGRFVAVVEVFTSSKTEQESLSVKLSGSYGAFSAKGGFSSEFSNAISNKSLKISVYSEGGVIPREPTSLEEVQVIASSFASTVEGSAVPYGVLLDKYSILDLPKPLNYIDLQNQLDVLAFCAQQRNSLWTSLNNVNYVFNNPGQFEIAAVHYDLAALAAYRTALENDLQAVKKAASTAIDHPKDAQLPVLAAVAPPMPKRREGEEDTLIGIGEQMANADPLISAIRDTQAPGAQRNGFLVGLATEAKNTLWGPGAQSIKDGLDGAGQEGFALAAALCLQRNNNIDAANRGAAVVKADPEVAAERAKDQPPGLYWLGFNIGTGLFGNPELGAVGSTLMGPGAEKVLESLDADGKRGFNAARDFNVRRRQV